MTIFARFKRERAVKRYVNELPRRLYNHYGASKYFTPGQIATAAKKLKLDHEFIVYGYAMFLPKDVFEELSTSMPNPLSYEEARKAFILYDATTPAANPNFYESELGFNTPGDGGSSGASF